MKYVDFVLLLIFIFSGCSKNESTDLPVFLEGIENLTVYHSNAEPLSSIQLTQQQSFGDSGDITIGQISGIAIDNYGRVFIAEAIEGHAAIHVFGSDGNYLKSLGGYGEGPGEFRSIINPQVRNGKLFALDAMQLRINSYSLKSLKYHDTIHLDPKNWRHIKKLNGASPSDFIPLGNDTFIISFLRSEGHTDLLFHYIMDKNGKIISDNISEQTSAEHFIEPDQRSVFYSPFSSNGLIAVAEDYFYTIWTENIFIKEHDLKGDYQRSFYYPFNNRKLDRDTVLNLYDSKAYQRAVKNTGIPESMPAVHSMLIDDKNRIWLSTIIEDQDQFEWWLLNTSGKLLATFSWPQNKEIQIIKNGSLYTLETDKTGLQEAVKYSLQMNQ